jgi:hypothetical protein
MNTLTTLFTKKSICLLSLCLVSFSHAAVIAFDYSGTQETFTVPEGVYSINSVVQGARGGSETNIGGYGHHITATFSVTPGQILQIIVGQAGYRPTDNTGTHEAFGGGGSGSIDSFSTTNAGYGGGGRSSIGLSSDNPFIVAGGGGGAILSVAGGSANSDLTGGAGNAFTGGPANRAGLGATPSSPGAGGTGQFASGNGESGVGLIGGRGGSGAFVAGGGGGGGYFGGGGGAAGGPDASGLGAGWGYGSGGAGSGFIDSEAVTSNVVRTATDSDYILSENNGFVSLEFSPIPESSSAIFIGLSGLALLMRRKR